MATTDQDTLTSLQYALIETPDGGLTVSSGLWSPQELMDALNDAQQWMMREVWPVVTRTTLVTIPNLNRYALPQEWMETIRVAWQESDGTTTALGRDSSWSADYAQEDWTYHFGGTPLIYSDSDAPIPQIQIMPAASDNGLLDVWYVAVPPTLRNTGVTWVLPDVLIPPCRWKALAELLAKDGRGQDLPRAAAALARATEGLTAARLMLQGWYAGLQ